jgi:hypothetical protein
LTASNTVLVRIPNRNSSTADYTGNFAKAYVIADS